MEDKYTAEDHAITTVQTWLSDTFGATGPIADQVQGGGTAGLLSALGLVLGMQDRPAMPDGVLASWRELIEAERHHLDQAERMLNEAWREHY